MKKIILLLAVMFLPFHIHGQIFDKLKNEAKKVVNQTSLETKQEKIEQSQKITEKTQSTTAVSNSKPAKDVEENESIIFSKTRGGVAEKNFLPTDNIYARVFFTKTLKEIFADVPENEEITFPIRFGFEKINTWSEKMYQSRSSNILITREDLKNDYLDIDILPALNDVKSVFLLDTRSRIKMEINRVLSEFEPNDGRLSHPNLGEREKFVLQFNSDEKWFGSFYFTVANQKELAVLQTRIFDNMKLMAAADVSNVKIPEAFSQPSGRFTDPQLSIAAIRAKLSDPSYTIMKLVIDGGQGADYEIRRNALGISEYKITAKPVWMIYKDKTGKCFYTRYYFRREHGGGGRYGALEIATTSAGQTPIACENVK